MVTSREDAFDNEFGEYRRLYDELVILIETKIKSGHKIAGKYQVGCSARHYGGQVIEDVCTAYRENNWQVSTSIYPDDTVVIALW